MRPEPFDRQPQTRLERNLRLPAQFATGQREVGLAYGRIVDRAPDVRDWEPARSRTDSLIAVVQ
jgi:hypothetical protein